MLLSPERTYRRKMREMLLARRIEQHFSKERDPLPLPEPDLLRARRLRRRRGGAHLLRQGRVESYRRRRGRAARGPAEGADALLAAPATRARRASAAATCSSACARRARSTRRRYEPRARARRPRSPPARAGGLRRGRLLHRGGAAPSLRGARRRARARAAGCASRRRSTSSSSAPPSPRCAPGSRRSTTARATAGRCAASTRDRRSPDELPRALGAARTRCGRRPATPRRPTRPARCLAARSPPSTSGAARGARRVRARDRCRAGGRVDGRRSWARRLRRRTSAPWTIREDRDGASSVGDVVRLATVQPRRAPTREGEPAAPRRADAARVTLAQKPAVQGALLSFDVESGEVLALRRRLRLRGERVRPRDAGASASRAPRSSRSSTRRARPRLTRPRLDPPRPPRSDRRTAPARSGGRRTTARKFLGPITMREALASSVNNATIHLMRDVGVERRDPLARRLGIESPLEPNLSLALGSSRVTLLELTRALRASSRTAAGASCRASCAGASTATATVDVICSSRRARTTPSGVAARRAPPERADPAAAQRRRRAALARDARGTASDGDPPATQAYLTLDLMRAVVLHPRAPARRRARSASRSRARPAPPTTRPTPGSSASRPTS